MPRGKPVQNEDEIKLQITPMIDVTFLLLVFFLTTLKFKTLERKVAAFLPKDRGLAKTMVKPEEIDKINVELKRAEGETVTRVKIMEGELGTGDAAFEQLRKKIESLHSRNPDLPGEIHAWSEVPHGEVVQAIDAFMTNDITEITFRGTSDPGKPVMGRGQ